ncbi:MATE efflux family protein DTX1 [Morella rubra]|uniref:MATE efflux family protein DTX1 n=1 Tax=Morella rubra TaxID=262757 RepID=A0A6A1VEG8_9ROSI|nr:MATE efflux family protein DTX1 [Morella rubra]
MGGKWRVVVKEMKMVSYVAAPMVVVTVLQYLLQVVSLMMVGHLDELSLSEVSIAASFTSVTGFSHLVKSLFPFSSSIWRPCIS